MRVILTVTRGPRGAGQTFTFEEHATFLVGRSRRAHFRLPSDRYSSRIHFLIEVNPPSCRLSDLGSRNGTRVNGGKVETCDLRDGDAIEVGHTTLRVTVEAVAEREPPTPPPSAVVPPPQSARPRPVAEGCPACGTALAGAADSPLCPACAEKAGRCEQAIPGYRIIEKLGGGAMGVVHLALDPHGEAVAVKTIKPGEDVSPAQVRRFLREAHVVHALDHPHIVKFFDRGEAGGKLYFAMEYVRGTDAARRAAEYAANPTMP